MNAPTPSDIERLEAEVDLARLERDARQLEVDALAEQVAALQLDDAYEWPATGELVDLVKGWTRLVPTVPTHRPPRTLTGERTPATSHWHAYMWRRAVRGDDAVIAVLAQALGELDARVTAVRDGERALERARQAVADELAARAREEEIERQRDLTRERGRIEARRRGVVPTIHLDWGDE